MTDLKNLTIKELKMLTELRNVNSYKNISKQQLESNILKAILSKSKPKSKEKPAFKPKQKSTFKVEANWKSKSESILNLSEVDETSKMKAAKSRQSSYLTLMVWLVN